MKKKSIRITALILCAALLVCPLTGCADSSATEAEKRAANATYNIKLATDLNPENFIVQALYRASDEIYEKSDGEVNIEIYPSGQIGAYGTISALVINGDIPMSATYFGWEYDSRLAIFSYPCLIESYDDFKKVMFPGGAMYELMDNIQSSLDVHLLGIMNAGMIGLGASKDLGDTFEEATALGVKKNKIVRIPALSNYEKLVSKMGYNTATIAYADLYTALQTGVATGFAGANPVGAWEGFRDIMETWVDTQFINEPMPILINQKYYDELPEKYQTLLDEEFLSISYEIADACEAEAMDTLQKFEEKGIKVLVPTTEEKAQFFKDVRNEVLQPLREEFNDNETFDSLMENLDIHFDQ